MFHMSYIAAIILVGVAWILDGPTLPTAPVGWYGLIGVVLLQISSLPLYLASIRRVGALKSSMVSNVQPVTSIVFAWLVFGEILSPLQMVGGTLVIGGIIGMQLLDRRDLRTPALGEPKS